MIKRELHEEFFIHGIRVIQLETGKLYNDCVFVKDEVENKSKKNRSVKMSKIKSYIAIKLMVLAQKLCTHGYCYDYLCDAIECERECK